MEMTFDLGVAADSHRDRPRSVNTSTVAVAGSGHAAIPLQVLFSLISRPPSSPGKSR